MELMSFEHGGDISEEHEPKYLGVTEFSLNQLIVDRSSFPAHRFINLS